MRPLDLNNVVGRLKDLRMYSPELSKRMEHEVELPEDAAAFLVERLEISFLHCEEATEANRAAALKELSAWLIRSYQYYLTRLAIADVNNVWRFDFPKTQTYANH